MNKTSKMKDALEVMVVIGLILLIPLFFATKTAADKQTGQNTPTPFSPTATDVPEVNSVTTAKQPPQCTFPLAQTTTAESRPEEYTFSEPQVVLTATHNIDLVEWLPDNQQVLIMQDIPDNNQQSIELFNSQTGKRLVYAIRNRINEPPSWFPELNAVVYPAMNILRVDKIKHRYEFTRQVWVSRGDPKNAQLVADNLSQFYVAVKPGRGQIAYLSDKQLAKRNALLEALQSVAFDSTQWEYRRNNFPPAAYEMAWQPGSSQVFLYSNGDTGGYTFLLDVETGQICEINLGSEGHEIGWAAVARWSPDGRYLAVVRSWGMLPINSSDLAVLDTATGNLYTMGIATQEMKGRHFVEDLAWAPDNRHLAVIGSVLPFPGSGPGSEESGYSGLYLADFISGQNVHLLPAHKFPAGWWGTNLAWSPDGSKLLVVCPTGGEEHLCLISVQRNNLP